MPEGSTLESFKILFGRGCLLGDDVVNNVAVHIGQPDIPTAESISKIGVIQPEQVKNGRM